MKLDELNIEKFKSWLIKRGAVIAAPTNPWEVLRFNAASGVGVIYKNRFDYLTFTGESEAAYTAWRKNKVWKAIDRKRVALRAKKVRLANRDGKRCFCCLKPFDFSKLTIEHLFNFSHGGTDNENNLGLACDDCQKLLGNLPVVKKIEVVIKRRKELGVIFNVPV